MNSHFQKKKKPVFDVLLLFCVLLCLWNLLEIKKSKLVYFSQDLATHKPFENRSTNVQMYIILKYNKSLHGQVKLS